MTTPVFLNHCQTCDGCHDDSVPVGSAQRQCGLPRQIMTLSLDIQGTTNHADISHLAVASDVLMPYLPLLSAVRHTRKNEDNCTIDLAKILILG